MEKKAPKVKSKSITTPRPIPKPRPEPKPKPGRQPVPGPDAGPIERFFHILNNRAKSDPLFGTSRERGFVVFVKEQRSLKLLEDACFDKKIQGWNKCITVRYKASGRHAIGSMLFQMAVDMSEYGHNQSMKIDSRISSKKIQKLESDLLRWVFYNVPQDMNKVESNEYWQKVAGNLSQGEILDLFTKIGKYLHIGERLVILCELTGAESDLSQWQAAKEQIFSILPERMGMVFSGSPGFEELEINAKDPHYLELELPEETPPDVAVYKHAALDSDVPTTIDYLNRRRYATALAGFILHPDVSPPLAVGIHGDWGTGKSSFMEMIKEELERVNKVGEKNKRELMHVRIYEEQKFKGIRFN